MAKVIDNPFRAYPFPPARLPFELAFHVFVPTSSPSRGFEPRNGWIEFNCRKKIHSRCDFRWRWTFFPSPQSQIKFLIIPRECLISSFSSLCALLSLPVDAEKWLNLKLIAFSTLWQWRAARRETQKDESGAVSLLKTFNFTTTPFTTTNVNHRKKNLIANVNKIYEYFSYNFIISFFRLHDMRKAKAKTPR